MMDRNIPLFQLAYSGASLYRAALEDVHIQPADPGQEQVSLVMRITDTYLGEPGEPLRRSEFTRPASETARLKFPDPVWSRVELEDGASIFLATQVLDENAADPEYVDQVQEPDDAVLNAAVAVLAFESQDPSSEERLDTYVQWLVGKQRMARLFAAEALARQPELAGVDPEGYVARAYVAALQSAEDIYQLISLAEFMFSGFYEHAGQDAQVILLNALIQAVESDQIDLQDLALDMLSQLSPAELSQKGVMRSEAAAAHLAERQAQEPEASERDRLLQLIQVLRGQA